MDKNGEIKSVEDISSTEYLALKDKIVKETKETKFNSSLPINKAHKHSAQNVLRKLYKDVNQTSGNNFYDK